MSDLPPLPYGPAEPHKGRQTLYSETLTSLICERMATGETLRKICRDANMPAVTTIYKWLSEHAEFQKRFDIAQALLVDHWGDEIIEISDDSSCDTYIDDNGNERPDNEVLQRSKLRVNTRQWLMGRLAPRKYGDRVEQTLKGDKDAPLTVEVLRLAPDVGGSVDPHSTS